MASYKITKQADFGTKDPEIMDLQKFLNEQGFTVASTGAGSKGFETDYFGPATQKALQQFQAQYGIATTGTPETTGYGRLGPKTLSQIQSLASKTDNKQIASSTTAGTQNQQAQMQNQQQQNSQQVEGAIQSALSSFQQDDNASIIKTIQEKLSAPAPTAPDLTSEYQKFQQQYGTATIETQLSGVDTEINQLKAAQQQDILNLGANLTSAVIRQKQTEKINADYAAKINNKINERNSLANELNTKYDIIKTMMDLTKTDYQNAQAVYQNDYNRAFQAYTTLNAQQDKQTTQAQANLKIVSDMISEGIKNGTLSDLESLPANIQTSLKQLELQAGYPEGLTQQILASVQPSKDEDFHYLSPDKTSVFVKYKDGSFDTFATGFSPEPTGIGGGGSTGDAELDAEAIINGTLSIGDISTANNYRATVGRILDKKKKEALKSGDIYGIMKSSAGGKDIDASQATAFEKATGVIYQINDLQNIFNDDKAMKSNYGVDLAPIEKIWRSKNPYDTKAQQIKAALQSIVPNLARGVYGEVGVLTDNDIKNYAQTLPTLGSTEDVRNAVLSFTIRTVQRSIENKIKTLAASGRNVSGFQDIYKNIDDVASGLLKPTGTNKTGQNPLVSGGTTYKSSSGKTFILPYNQ